MYDLDPSSKNGKPQASQENERPEEFLTDTQKVVRRHLENENDMITEEDIRNVRVGMTPTESTYADQREEKLEQEIDKIVEADVRDDDKDPNDEPLTPWDTIKE